VIVISHGLWQRRFGGDPNIIGREITSAARQRLSDSAGRFPVSYQR
jgi:hypothetical protein